MHNVAGMTCTQPGTFDVFQLEKDAKAGGSAGGLPANHPPVVDPDADCPTGCVLSCYHCAAACAQGMYCRHALLTVEGWRIAAATDRSATMIKLLAILQVSVVLHAAHYSISHTHTPTHTHTGMRVRLMVLLGLLWWVCPTGQPSKTLRQSRAQPRCARTLKAAASGARQPNVLPRSA